MKNFFVISTFFLFSLSCGEKEEKIPDYVWEEERFVEVLTEFQKTESIIRLGYHQFEDSIYSKDSVYAAMFDKMKVVEEDFDSNYRYFMRDPARMEKIYDQVIIRLSEQEAELLKKKPKKKKKKKKKKKRGKKGNQKKTQ